MFTIKKIVKKGKYLYAVVPEHPNATRNGYVLHHRVTVENHLNRLLTYREVVHHLNGDTHDNSVSNLQVMLREEHARLHAKHGRIFVKLVCPNCGKEFEREKRNVHPQTLPKCSRKCNGEFSRRLQIARGMSNLRNR